MFLPARHIVLCMAFLTAIAGSSTAQAQSLALIDKVKAEIAANTPRLEVMFKDLHGNPELAFTETRTAGIVAAELKRLGFSVTSGIGKTGVVGVLKNGPGPTLWYRADMDANGGVRETTGLPWAAMKPQTLADGNVIPASATLLLNLRWLKPQVRELMLKRIDEINNGIATAAGVPADRVPTRTMKGHAGPLVNDPALVERNAVAAWALLESKAQASAH